MAEIIPAIIGQDFKEVASKIAAVEGLVNWAQLDIMDGFFAPAYSWNTPDDLCSLGGKIKLEAHLMIEEPEQYIADWMNVVDRILVHFESTERLEEIIKQLHTSQTKLGFVLLNETPVSVLDPYLDRINYVQLMAIDQIGFHGHPFNDEVINRVKAIREKHPSVTIAVDGGVSLDNTPALLEAGVNNLVVGSALWNSKDISKAVNNFYELIRRQS